MEFVAGAWGILIALIGALVLGVVLLFVPAAIFTATGTALRLLLEYIVLPIAEWSDPYVAPYLHPLIRLIQRLFTVATASLQWIFQYRVAQWCAGVLCIAAFIILQPIWYLYYEESDVPDPQIALQWRPSQIGYMLDRNGLVVIRLAVEYRETVSSEYVPEVVRQALVSAEDKRFWEHTGWDTTATARGVFNEIKHVVTNSDTTYRQQGASTITQQIARALYLEEWRRREDDDELLVDNPLTRIVAAIKGPVRANLYTRKLREIKYAIHLERTLSKHFEQFRPPPSGWKERIVDVLGLYDGRRTAKEFLLGIYANMVYLGHGVYGMSYGARFYFGKEMEQLTPDEAAFLASLLPAPNAYGALDDDQQIRSQQIKRRNDVLERMADNGYIDPARLTMLRNRPLNLRPPRLQTKTEEPALVSRAEDELTQLGYSTDDVHHGRISVRLTGDGVIQSIVNAAAHDGIYGTDLPAFPGYAGMYGVRNGNLPQVAVVVLGNKTAEILAMFGGIYEARLHNYTLYNRATQARRPAGSTFKAFTALAAISRGMHPDDLVYDRPLSLNMGGWYKPIRNYDGRHQGAIPLREAIAQSRNVPILRLVRDEFDGIGPVIQWAHTAGIASELEPYISTALGASGVTVLEMANAYRALATGWKAQPHVIASIYDAHGSPRYQAPERHQPLPLSKQQLSLVQELLRGTVRLPRGTARSLDTSNFPIPVLAKTGTTDEHRDTWFIASTYGEDGITIAVWVGYDDNTPLAKGATGSGVALPIAREILRALYGPAGVLGNPPLFPAEIEQRIDAYIAANYPEQTK